MTITDSTLTGATLHSFTLESLAEQMTAREIIRARIYQEVQDHNRKPLEIFRGLVSPTAAEVTLNGAKVRKTHVIDWEQQFRHACQAFESNGFFLLVGDRQAESLDEQFTVGVDTEVSFVKLTPLVGG